MASPNTGDDKKYFRKERGIGDSQLDIKSLTQTKDISIEDTTNSESVTKYSNKSQYSIPQSTHTCTNTCPHTCTNNELVKAIFDPCDTKGSSTDPCDTKESCTDPCDTKESCTDPCDTKESCTDPCDTKESSTDPCDTKESSTDPCDIKGSSTDPCDTKGSSTDPCDTKESCTDPCDTKESSTYPCDTKESSADLSNTKESSPDPCDTKESSICILKDEVVNEEDTSSVGFDFCFTEEVTDEKLTEDNVGLSRNNLISNDKNSSASDLAVCDVWPLNHLVNISNEEIFTPNKQQTKGHPNIDPVISSVILDDSTQNAHGLCSKHSPHNIKAKRLKLDALVENIKSLKAAELNKTDEPKTFSKACDTLQKISGIQRNVSTCTSAITCYTPEEKNSQNNCARNVNVTSGSVQCDGVEISKIHFSKVLDCSTKPKCDSFSEHGEIENNSTKHKNWSQEGGNNEEITLSCDKTKFSDGLKSSDVSKFEQGEEFSHRSKSELQTVNKFDSCTKSLSCKSRHSNETDKVIQFDNNLDLNVSRTKSSVRKTEGSNLGHTYKCEETTIKPEGSNLGYTYKCEKTTIKPEVVQSNISDSTGKYCNDRKLVEPVRETKLLKSPVFRLEGQKDNKFCNVIRQPVVFLGERVSRSVDEAQALTKLANVKQKKPVKKIEMIRHRRVKRVASLNALAMVNILFGKDESPPKSQKSGDVKSNSKKVITNKSLSKAKLILEAKVKSLLKKAKTEENSTKKTSPQKISQIEKSLAKLSLESPKTRKTSRSENVSNKEITKSSKKESQKLPSKDSQTELKTSSRRPKSVCKGQKSPSKDSGPKSVSKGLKSPSKGLSLKELNKVQLSKSSKKSVKHFTTSGQKSPVKVPSQISENKSKKRKNYKETIKEKNKSDEVIRQNKDVSKNGSNNGEKKTRKKKGELMRAARTHTFPQPKAFVDKSPVVSQSKCANCLKRHASHSKTDSESLHAHDGTMIENNMQYNRGQNGSYTNHGYGVLPGNCLHCSQSNSLYNTPGASGFIIGQAGGLVSPCLTIGPMVQYHPYSTGYPIQYSSTLPHCGCPSCYYYTPTASPLHHDTCHHGVSPYVCDDPKQSGDHTEIDVVTPNIPLSVHSRDQQSSCLFGKTIEDGECEIDVVGGVPPVTFTDKVTPELPKKKKKDPEKVCTMQTEKTENNKNGKQALCDKENADKKTRNDKDTMKKVKKKFESDVDRLSKTKKKRTLCISSVEVKAKKKKIEGKSSNVINLMKKKDFNPPKSSSIVTSESTPDASKEKKTRTIEYQSKSDNKSMQDKEIKVLKKKKKTGSEIDRNTDKTSFQINQSKSYLKKSPAKQNDLTEKAKFKTAFDGSKGDKKSAKIKNDVISGLNDKKEKGTFNRSKSVDSKGTKKDRSKTDLYKRSQSLDPRPSKKEISKTYPKRKRAASFTRQLSTETIPKKVSLMEKKKKVDTKKVKTRNHSWEFNNTAEKRKIMVCGSIEERYCYPAIRHTDGDIINVRDVVILRSGPRKTDIPFLAKVTAFWEENDEMMMSLLWYYHPEHTDTGRQSHHLQNEIFASKHRDENSVACIDDKGYVLTYNEYCRYRAEKCRVESNLPPRLMVVPSLGDNPRLMRIPSPNADVNTVYMCRQVYDFKLRRILKNPS